MIVFVMMIVMTMVIVMMIVVVVAVMVKMVVLLIVISDNNCISDGDNDGEGSDNYDCCGDDYDGRDCLCDDDDDDDDCDSNNGCLSTALASLLSW